MKAPFLVLVALSSLIAGQSSPTEALFPVPQHGLQIPAQEGPQFEAERWSMRRLLDEYARVTNTNLMISSSMEPTLQRMGIPIDGPLDIRPEDVHSVVESLLVHEDIVLTLKRAREPRLVGVHGLQTAARTNLRSDALWVSSDDLEEWESHPAFLISTVVHLENLDTRHLTNSIRAMLTDANTQQIIPVGSTHSLMLTGFANELHGFVEILKEINEHEGKLAKSRESSNSEE